MGNERAPISSATAMRQGRKPAPGSSYMLWPVASAAMKGNVARSSRRRDIEGLRAVAILAVVAYHCGLPVPGGYVGVDVFFVISGYLITSLLWKELSGDGHLSFAGFYARRARRLLPSAVLVIVATVLVSIAVTGPLMATAVAKDAVACALYVGNYRFASPGDQLSELAGARVAPAELLVARRRGAVLSAVAGPAARGVPRRAPHPGAAVAAVTGARLGRRAPAPCSSCWPSSRSCPSGCASP